MDDKVGSISVKEEPEWLWEAVYQPQELSGEDHQQHFQEGESEQLGLRD